MSRSVTSRSEHGRVLKQILLERYPDKMGLFPAAVSGI